MAVFDVFRDSACFNRYYNIMVSDTASVQAQSYRADLELKDLLIAVI